MREEKASQLNVCLVKNICRPLFSDTVVIQKKNI